MSHNNPLTVKRHKQELVKMIFETMANEDTSLLQAQGIVMRMVTDDEVTDAVKLKVEQYNA